MAALLLTSALWLDLRGTPSVDGLGAMLELYTGVRSRFTKAGLGAPSGAAISGIFHDAADVKGDDDPEDGGLSLLVVRDGSLWADGKRVGASISAALPLKEANGLAHAAVRKRERNVALLGTDKSAILALFEFTLSQAQHCRNISGAEVSLFCECIDLDCVSAVQEAGASDDTNVPVAAILPPDAGLWFDALRTRS